MKRKISQPTVSTPVNVNIKVQYTEYFSDGTENLQVFVNTVSTSNPIQTIQRIQDKYDQQYGHLNDYMFTFKID